MRRDLEVGLLYRLRPATIVVAQLVRGEVLGAQPRSGLEADDVQSRLHERQRRDTAHCAEPDDDDVGLLELSRHDGRPRLIQAPRARADCLKNIR